MGLQFKWLASPAGLAGLLRNCPPTDGLGGRLAPGGPTDLGLRHIRLAGRLLRELLRLLDKAGHLRDLTPAR